MPSSKIYIPTDMIEREYTWNIEKNFDGSRSIVFYHRGKKVLSAGAYEAIELLGRDFVMKHVNVCDGTPWLSRWKTPPAHKLQVDKMFEELRDALARENKNYFELKDVVNLFFSGSKGINNQLNVLIEAWEAADLIKEIEVGPWGYGWKLTGKNP